MTSNEIKLTFVTESKLFVAMTFGAIWMYDDFPPYEKIGHIQTHDKVVPSSMCIKTTGVLLVGLVNGSIEMFKFDQSGIERAAYTNQLKIPEAGEIYDMAVVNLPQPTG